MSKYGTKWSDEETIIAFYYYCRLPFGKLTKTNPEIIRIATLLDRTPSSVVLKMCNLAHFDPEMQKRSVKGMSNASKTDSAIVARFFENWEELTYEAQQIETMLTAGESPQKPDLEQLPSGNTIDQVVKARINQDFFREAVLSSYQGRCCITGINVPTLLIASHIKPWKDSDPNTERTNPSNGLCLNALHDRAFDQGLITVLPDFTVRVSSQLNQRGGDDSTAWLRQCDKQKIQLPGKFIPAKHFLEYHNDVIFVP